MRPLARALTSNFGQLGALRSAWLMAILGCMKPIGEDHASEARAEVAARQARGIAGVLTQTAANLCNGDPAVTTLLLATALGQLAAQTGVELAQVTAIIERERDLTRAILDHQNALWKKQSDA